MLHRAKVGAYGAWRFLSPLGPYKLREDTAARVDECDVVVEGRVGGAIGRALKPASRLCRNRLSRSSLASPLLVRGDEEDREIVETAGRMIERAPRAPYP